MNFNFFPLWRPEKISWVYQNPDPDLIIQRFKSKSSRKFLNALDNITAQHKFRFEFGVCSLDQYLEWLTLYQLITDTKNFDKFATPDWYTQKLQENKIIERIFIYQDKKLIGGKIITISADETVRSAFKISINFDFNIKGNASLGVILDYLYLDTYIKRGFKKLTGGHSRNLFGITNTIGYLCFKLRIGYSAEVEVEKNTFCQELVRADQIPFCTFLTTHSEKNSFPELYGYGTELLRPSEYIELKSLLPIKNLEHT